MEVSEKSRILINGIGSGLDIPHLPEGPNYIGIDITPAMLALAEQRLQHRMLNLRLQEADSLKLPFADDHFDFIVMHLILAVVPDSVVALQEAVRVLKPGGRIHILDKFLKPGEKAPFRRLVNPLISRIATRTDVVFEDLLKLCSPCEVVIDEPALAGGWFRFIVLEKS